MSLSIKASAKYFNGRFFFLFFFIELKSTGTAHHFAFLLNSTDYRILRMDEDHDRMYVGSKDYILSLDLNDINKEPLIVRFLNYTRQIATNKTISKAWQ